MFSRRAFSHIKSPRKFLPGFTLIEIVVYVALFGMISVFLIQSLITLGTVYRKLQAERDVVASMRNVMEIIGRETQAAGSVYTPTSVFGNPIASQMSLQTPLNAGTNETVSYVDFYVDNGRLYIKRERDAALPLTSESVRVTAFSVWRVLAGARESLQVTIQITSGLSGSLQSSSLATASFSPRGNY